MVLKLVFSDETFNQERVGCPILFGLLSISMVEISPNFNVKVFWEVFPVILYETRIYI